MWQKTSSESRRREIRAAQKRVSGRHVAVLTYPCPSRPCFGGSNGRARVTGKAGENGQHSGEIGGSSPWTRPSAPECGDTLKALAGDQRPIYGGGIVLEDGSEVAIDWVTGRSYSSAQRRLNVQSGQPKGGKCAAAPYPSVAVRDRGH